MEDRSFEVFLAFNVRLLGIAASADTRKYAIEPSMRFVVDDPAVLLVFVYLFDFGSEDCLFLKSVRSPESCDLSDNLLPVWISAVYRQRLNSSCGIVNQRILSTIIECATSKRHG